MWFRSSGFTSGSSHNELDGGSKPSSHCSNKEKHEDKLGPVSFSRCQGALLKPWSFPVAWLPGCTASSRHTHTRHNSVFHCLGERVLAFQDQLLCFLFLSQQQSQRIRQLRKAAFPFAFSRQRAVLHWLFFTWKAKDIQKQSPLRKSSLNQIQELSNCPCLSLNGSARQEKGMAHLNWSTIKVYSKTIYSLHLTHSCNGNHLRRDKSHCMTFSAVKLPDSFCMFLRCFCFKATIFTSHWTGGIVPIDAVAKVPYLWITLAQTNTANMFLRRNNGWVNKV